MKVCQLCNQEIKDNDSVVAILGARYVQKEGSFDLQVMRQAILSHFQCPAPAAPEK